MHLKALLMALTKTRYITCCNNSKLVLNYVHVKSCLNANCQADLHINMRFLSLLNISNLVLKNYFDSGFHCTKNTQPTLTGKNVHLNK